MAPQVHTFLYEIYRKEAHLGALFACIAEIDVYLAIANKIVESQSTEHPYCFTNFIENSKPRIEAESCWNVLIPHPVTNDFCEHHNVIVSGPNAGGKSTYIRMLLQNLIFSQVFGVAAGKRFDHTPFNTINSFINTSDDLMNGLSLFACEVKRAQEIIETIKGLPAEHKFFFALDELFTGTAAEQGEKCACEFVKRIATSDRVQFIYATHFDKLKALGNNHSSCVNYKVDAPHKGANGKLIYPFTVSKGASDINVALDIAQDAGLFA
jgi:DNA mismatch repair protein MutS